MDIEQIAKEAWVEVCKSSSVGQSIAEPFLRRCLSKLAEQTGEPVDTVVAFGDSLHEISWKGGKLPPLNTKLYTEAQLIAAKQLAVNEYRRTIETIFYTQAQYESAQQRTAEACAKVCENLPHKFRTEFSKVSSECAAAIRNNWREYL